ncbi:sporulation protein [Bacillus safensis]|nr:sporulation protein [Bacillus sp. WP8]KUR62019.1 sporulation protein [Bacillus sp. AM 13(2015)]PCK11294.1 sporulation protein [Bacillus safensis]
MKYGKIIIMLSLLLSPMMLDVKPVDARGLTAAADQWETRAVKEAKKRYPLTQVLFKQKVWDRHRDKESVKQYHITLKDHTKEFGVFVTISYNPYSNKVNKVIVVEEYN